MLIYIYSRKSVYTGKGESIENQIEMCRQYLFREIPGICQQDIVVYEDEGFSGKNLERPQFRKMMEDAKKQKPDYLVCYRLDRISRSVSDFAPLIENLNNRGINFICIKEKFDTSTPMGKAMMYIASVFAQLERETIAERVRDNMLMLARTGRWLGGTPPTGFTSEKVEEVYIDGKSKSSCKLKFDPKEIKIAALMFDKFQELRSVSGVCKYLMRQSIKSRTGKTYSQLGIKEILQNPVYCIADRDALQYFRSKKADVCFTENQCSDKFGLLSYNKRDYKKKAAPRLSIDQWIIAIGKHRGIVSGREWVAVQDALEHNKLSGSENRLRNDYALLSGLIRCDRCGERLFSKPRSNSPDLFDYMCNHKIMGGAVACDCPNINGKQADNMVCQWLLDYTHEDANIYPLLEQLKKELAVEEKTDPVKEIEDQIKERSKEINNLIQSLSQTGSTLVRYINGRVTELDTEMEQLACSLQAVKAQKLETQSQGELLELMANALSDLKQSFGNLSIQEKRFLIRLLVQKIHWDGTDLHIFMNGE